MKDFFFLFAIYLGLILLYVEEITFTNSDIYKTLYGTRSKSKGCIGNILSKKIIILKTTPAENKNSTKINLTGQH